ncbi:hypothetical protein VDGL01_12506 [Verticillium dahliae]
MGAVVGDLHKGKGRLRTREASAKFQQGGMFSGKCQMRNMGNGKGEHQISGVAAEWGTETLPTTWGARFCRAIGFSCHHVSLPHDGLDSSVSRARDRRDLAHARHQILQQHQHQHQQRAPPFDKQGHPSLRRSTSLQSSQGPRRTTSNWPIPDELIDWPDSDVRWPPRDHQLHAVDCRTTFDARQPTHTLRLLFYVRPCRCATKFSV